MINTTSNRLSGVTKWVYALEEVQTAKEQGLLLLKANYCMQYILKTKQLRKKKIYKQRWVQVESLLTFKNSKRLESQLEILKKWKR